MTGVDKLLARVRMTISLMLLAQAAEESLMAKDLDFKESMGGKSKFLLKRLPENIFSSNVPKIIRRKSASYHLPAMEWGRKHQALKVLHDPMLSVLSIFIAPPALFYLMLKNNSIHNGLSHTSA